MRKLDFYILKIKVIDKLNIYLSIISRFLIQIGKLKFCDITFGQFLSGPSFYEITMILYL